MQGQQQVDWRGIGWFLAITFGITWAVEFIMIFGMRMALAGTISPVAQILLVAVMFIPALATVIVTKFITREGLGETGLRLGSWRGYVNALVLIIMIFAGAYLLTWLTGQASPDWSLSSYEQMVQEITGQAVELDPVIILLGLFFSTLTVNPLITSIATLGEELGWRGYLLPKLLPLGKGPALLYSGIIWGLWHAPIIVAGYNYPGYPLLGVFLMTIFTVLSGIVLGYYRITYNSVLLASWAHAVINTQARGIWFVLFPIVNPVWGGVTGLTGLVVWAGVAWWMYQRIPDRIQNDPEVGEGQ